MQELTENSVFEISYEDFIIGKQESEEKTAKVIQALNQLTNRQKKRSYTSNSTRTSAMKRSARS